MARDIIEMKAEEMTCPHCGKSVLMRWQMAYYELGESSPQFIGLEKAVSVNDLRDKTFPKRTIKSPPKPRPRSLKDIKEAVKKAPPKRAKLDLVQLQNPITKHWVVVDKTLGSIIKHSRTSRPYKHIPIIQSSKPLEINPSASSKEETK